GMTCENCARRVENALNALEGVWATVRIDTHTARVRCKTEPDEAALRGAVTGAGYVVNGFTEKTSR
ncbi:MAG: heavy-metal-associated domain-containing protein, partial [Clostridia bacterium]|nr:heavy-metal-associated domain-containing protein [Clostridia bacterium]